MGQGYPTCQDAVLLSTAYCYAEHVVKHSHVRSHVAHHTQENSYTIIMGFIGVILSFLGVIWG